jgi:hypothetical protein
MIPVAPLASTKPPRTPLTWQRLCMKAWTGTSRGSRSSGAGGGGATPLPRRHHASAALRPVCRERGVRMAWGGGGKARAWRGV